MAWRVTLTQLIFPILQLGEVKESKKVENLVKSGKELCLVKMGKIGK